MRLAYVAGPHRGVTHHDTFRNVEAARKTARSLIEAGYAVITPHVIIHSLYGSQRVGDDCPEIDALCIRWLDSCDLLVLTTTDWHRSVGTRAEVLHATKHGIPVVSLEEAIACTASESA